MIQPDRKAPHPTWVLVASAVSAAAVLLVLLASPAVSWTAGRTLPSGNHSLEMPASGTGLPAACANFTITVGAIGDYGDGSDAELAVANLVKSWNPDFIITTGDNNYPDGAAATIDDHIGQYYAEFIGNYVGSYGSGPAPGRPARFFPTLGNHDWASRSGDPPLPQAYLDYFTLPGNERYYQFVRGPIAFFALDSDDHEPDGNDSSGAQAGWLRTQLAAANAPWKLVYMHHAPFSSAGHGASPTLQWPFAEWGADAVLAGHDHTYERLSIDDFPYFVNGLGGRSRYDFGLPIDGSITRYNDDYGAMRIQANHACILFEFINTAGTVIDSYVQLHQSLYLPLLLKAP